MQRSVAAPHLAWQLGLPRAVALALRSQVTAAGLIAHGAAVDPVDAVHELRRVLRRLRALLRLAGEGLGWPASRRAWRRLAQLSRSLSAVRDAAVLPATVGRLPVQGQAAMQPLLEALELSAAPSDATIGQALQGIAEATAAAVLPLAGGSDALESRHLRRGMQRILHALWRARRRAKAHPTAKRLHSLRKRAKDARHALEWLGIARDRRLLRLHKDLVMAVDLLGEVTDNVALRHAIRRHHHAGRPAAAAVRRQIRRQIRRHAQPALQRCRRVRDLCPSQLVARARAAVLAVPTPPATPAGRCGQAAGDGTPRRREPPRSV
jgi:CHAD domain-containing protein